VGCCKFATHTNAKVLWSYRGHAQSKFTEISLVIYWSGARKYKHIAMEGTSYNGRRRPC
jgi:hypothetical protein